MTITYQQIQDQLFKRVSIAPLVGFRIVFGLVLLYSTLRTWDKGWIKELYIDPVYHFSFIKGLEPLSGNGMYIVFALLGITAVGITIGLLYRICTGLHFLLFTYVELLDKTFYLNHYYLVTLLLFWMLWVPAHHWFSIDGMLFPQIRSTVCSWWQIGIFKFQLSIVYFFAGLAKVNGDWLLRAQPLATWLPGLYDVPIIGSWLHLKPIAFLFSWAGCLYDLTIWIFLWIRKTRPAAYVLVIGFHVMTAILFPRIGMFPYIMVASTIIFFSANWHQKVLNLLGAKFPSDEKVAAQEPRRNKLIAPFILCYLAIQVYLPLRYIQYPGNLFWNEQGYRFSWRVMLMEKNGQTEFILNDPKTDIRKEVDQDRHLTPFQKAQMRSQPDMMLQFAQYIGDDFTLTNGYAPEVYVKSRLSLNARRSQVFTDETIDVYSLKNPMQNNWIQPLKPE